MLETLIVALRTTRSFFFLKNRERASLPYRVPI